jgi:uncharacterized membrane protein
MCNTSWLLPVIFIVLALPSTLLFALLTPPFQVPDETEHYFYARSISLGDVFPEQFKNGGAGGLVTTTDQRLMQIFNGIPFKPAVKVTKEMLESAMQLPRGSVVSQNYWGAAIYPPSAYAVPAAALFVLNHLGLDPLYVFFGGRVANSIAYVLCGALAIWLVPVGRLAFLLVLLLPMSLSQAGSFSADAQTFLLAALICALVAREAQRDCPAFPGLIFAAALLVLLSTTKAPMIALVFPLVAVSCRRSKTLAVVLGTIVVTLFLLWIYKFVLTDATAARAARLGVSSSEQVSFLLSNPIDIIKIAINTVEKMTWRYVQGAIGIFGWLDTTLKEWFYVLAILCSTAVAAITTTDKRIGYNLIFLISALLATALTFGALYVSWSKPGADIVSGVQGRYFIPIMFPTALALAGLATRRRLWLAIELAPVIILWVVSSAYIPLVLVDRYYLQ